MCRCTPLLHTCILSTSALLQRATAPSSTAPAIVPLALGDAGHEFRSAVVHEIRCREGVRPAQIHSHRPLLHHDTPLVHARRDGDGGSGSVLEQRAPVFGSRLRAAGGFAGDDSSLAAPGLGLGGGPLRERRVRRGRSRRFVLSGAGVGARRWTIRLIVRVVDLPLVFGNSARVVFDDSRDASGGDKGERFRILGRGWIGVGDGSGENEKDELFCSPRTPPNQVNSARHSRVIVRFSTSSCPTSILDSSTEAITGSLDPARYYKTVTRPASPDPLYGFEVVHREDGADDDQWPFKRASPFRSLLPRIWDAISASPPRASRPHSSATGALTALLSLAAAARGQPLPAAERPRPPWDPQLQQQQQQAPSPTPTAAVPSTSVPLTLEQQHITPPLKASSPPSKTSSPSSIPTAAST
ncbi:hypothetical protein B0H14DRAFT_3138799 [Mycena olivaceomarginata]|nr:hypothetical protein B0H14DRAFT_3138799 [Mycena olivaceomarginata]